MRTIISVAATVVALGVLHGCAATPQPLQIGVTDEGFSAGGQVVRTRAELTEAIRRSGATACRVMPSATTAYEQVETAMRALREAGCRSGIVGNVQP